MKKYIKPAYEVQETETESMIAESIGADNTPHNGINGNVRQEEQIFLWDFED